MSARRIALLRGINLGGKRLVAMADLRAFFTRLGFSDVQTLLQSGNVVFTSRGAARTSAALEALLEKAAEKALGMPVEFHVRSAAEWQTMIEANPFRAEAASDPSHLLVSFFKTTLLPANVAALRTAITGRETLHAAGRHLYMVFPDGIGNSKTVGLIDRKLAARGTARNWNTVLKLAALADR